MCQAAVLASKARENDPGSDALGRHGRFRPVAGRRKSMMITRKACLALITLVTLAMPASAQWTRVTEIPDAPTYSVWVNGDTVTASSDGTVYLSTDAGATWKGSVIAAAG